MDIKELNINIEQRTNRNHPWEYARAKVVCNLLKKRLPDTISAVDVGCGDVFFLNQFSQRFSVHKAVAVDTAFTDDIVASLKQNHRDIMFVNDIDEVDLQGEKADVVFLMDVIEHIENDVDFLKKLSEASFVGEKTLFMITVPAFNILFSSHDKFVGHYRRYTHRILHKTINDSGMNSIHSGYLFFSLIFPRFVIRTLEMINGGPKKTPHGAGGWNKGKLISKGYEYVLRIDGELLRLLSLIGIRLPGLSTYVICKLR